MASELQIEGSSGESTSISLTCTPEYEDVSHAESREFVVMCSLKAAQYKPENRAPIDLIIIIDKSGSMSGDRIKLTKETSTFVVRNLDATDRCGIVVYSSAVATLFPLTKMDAEGKANASRNIESLGTDGCTNLCGGLVEALDQMRKREESNEVSSVFLFTDGQANEGYTEAHDIIRATIDPTFASHSAVQRRGHYAGYNRGSPMKKQRTQQQQQGQGNFLSNIFSGISNIFSNSTSAVAPQQTTIGKPVEQEDQKTPGDTPGNTSGEQLPLPCTINTFGFGQNHNADLLRAIAEHGKGMYYYIENEAMIADVFADCLGGLISTVGQNVELAITAEGGQIKRVMTKFKTSVKANVHTVNLGDLQSEENRNLLVELQLPTLPEPATAWPVLSARLTYQDVIKGVQDGVGPVTCRMHRSGGTVELGERNFLLDQQHNRIIAAEAMAEATQLAEDGDLPKARLKVLDAKKVIDKSPSNSSPFVVNLQKDLDTCASGLRDRTQYNTTGQMMMNAMVQQCGMERFQTSPAVSGNYNTSECYNTSSRSAMQQRFKSGY